MTTLKILWKIGKIKTPALFVALSENAAVRASKKIF